MSSIFDKSIDRKHSNSLKYDFNKVRNYPDDVLPMWVADMDFRVPNEVLQTLHKRIEHGIFGYTDTKDDYFITLKAWFLKQHGYDIKKEWLVKTPGVVFALAHCVKAFTQISDNIMILTPVYYPFYEVIKDNNRQIVTSSLLYEHEEYKIDFKDLEAKIIDYKVKMFILCSPHNPVGRVWRRQELQQIINICKKHQVILISDEIHMDLVFDGYKHWVAQTIDPSYQDIIICTSASKTFNLAGLQLSNIFIQNEALRTKFKKEIDKSGYSQPNSLGVVATKVAYEKGVEWLYQLKRYLQKNYEYLKKFLQENLPTIKMVKLEATYLLWLDFRGYHLTEAQLNDMIISKAKLWLDRGTMFGEEGIGFQRINIAVPRAVLKKAAEQLVDAFKQYESEEIYGKNQKF